jgi:hypothetical protein
MYKLKKLWCEFFGHQYRTYESCIPQRHDTCQRCGMQDPRLRVNRAAAKVEDALNQLAEFYGVEVQDLSLPKE